LSGPDDSLDPAKILTYTEKPSLTTTPGYAGEFIGNNFGSEQFTDPRVSQWYPNSAELYQQELAQAQVQQREQTMRPVLQQQQAVPNYSTMTRFGQKIGSRRAPMNAPKKGGLRIIKPKLGALAGTLMNKITDATLTGGFPIKLSFDEQALLSKYLNAGVRAGLQATVPPGAVGSSLHPHNADYNANTAYGFLEAASDRQYKEEKSESDFQVSLPSFYKQVKAEEAKYLAGKQDSVDAFKAVAKLAAGYSNNDTAKFVRYMDYVLIGKEGQPLKFMDTGKLPRVLLGDKGYNKAYQDHSREQSRHFWALVSYAYKYGREPADFINFSHETYGPVFWDRIKNPKSVLGSKEDYFLSKAAIASGLGLHNGRLTPKEFVGELDTILRTDRDAQSRSSAELSKDIFAITAIDSSKTLDPMVQAIREKLLKHWEE
jgi:hypothetical protein